LQALYKEHFISHHLISARRLIPGGALHVKVPLAAPASSSFYPFSFGPSPTAKREKAKSEEERNYERLLFVGGIWSSLGLDKSILSLLSLRPLCSPSLLGLPSFILAARLPSYAGTSWCRKEEGPSEGESD
jgi:hypothetical protein